MPEGVADSDVLGGIDIARDDGLHSGPPTAQLHRRRVHSMTSIRSSLGSTQAAPDGHGRPAPPQAGPLPDTPHALLGPVHAPPASARPLCSLDPTHPESQESHYASTSRRSPRRHHRGLVPGPGHTHTCRRPRHNPGGRAELHLPSGESTVSISSGGVRRTAIVYRPADARRQCTACPSDSARQFEPRLEQVLVSGIEKSADRHSFLAVAPQGSCRWTADTSGMSPASPVLGGPDDERFSTDLLDDLAARGCAERHQVLATGYSGGGRMVSQYACDHPDRVSAVAPVSGLRAGTPATDDSGATVPASGTCTPKQPVPVLTFHGTADPVNPLRRRRLAVLGLWHPHRPRSVGRERPLAARGRPRPVSPSTSTGISYPGLSWRLRGCTLPSQGRRPHLARNGRGLPVRSGRSPTRSTRQNWPGSSS